MTMMVSTLINGDLIMKVVAMTNKQASILSDHTDKANLHSRDKRLKLKTVRMTKMDSTY